MLICVKCGEREHKLTQCKAEKANCFNCGGEHNALAVICQVRKRLIKDGMKEMRKKAKSRSRSRSQARQEQQPPSSKIKAGKITYAQAMGGAEGGMGDTVALSEIGDINKMTTAILTAIIYAHYVESMSPGTFQENVDLIM